jgi:hypothetical protein
MSVLVSLKPEFYRADGLDGFTATSEFAPKSALAMMWLSQLAYETDHPDTVRTVLAKFNLKQRLLGNRGPIERLFGPKACFIVAAGRGATFVMFAGTDPLKIEDWFTDFKLAPTPDALHEGFAKAVDNAMVEIMPLIKNRGTAEQPLFFTGHSMGGALAEIAALRALEEEHIRATAIYTFGGPRAGGRDFFNRYTPDLGERTFRLVHGDDIVASVPPSLLGIFRHVGRLVHCGRGLTFEGIAPASSADNDPSFILSGLDALTNIKFDMPDLATLEDPRGFDRSNAIPLGVRDHVPASYFRALKMPLLP